MKVYQLALAVTSSASRESPGCLSFLRSHFSNPFSSSLMIHCPTETTMVYFDVHNQLKSSRSRVTISFFGFYFLPKYNISLSAWISTWRWNPTRTGHNKSTPHTWSECKSRKPNLHASSWYSVCESHWFNACLWEMLCACLRTYAYLRWTHDNHCVSEGGW